MVPLQSEWDLTGVNEGLQVSACGELARLGLVAGTPEPAAATALYDWDLATAALAASHAVKRQLDASLAQSRPAHQPSPQPKGVQLPRSCHALCLPRTKHAGWLPFGVVVTLCGHVCGGCFAEAQAASTAAAAPAKRGFGSFLNQVKDAANRVVDDTSKNLSQAGLAPSSRSP